jgi:hypothetical protein
VPTAMMRAMKRRLTVAALVVLVAVCGVISGSASALPQKDRALSQALAFWRSKKCVEAPDQTIWIHGWRFNALFGNCRGGDGHDQHVYFFDRGRSIGTDGLGTSAEVFGLWRDDRTFAFMYVIYKPQDGLCCPTGGGKIVRFKWNGKQFRALDSPPPRRTNTKAGR